MYVCVCNAVTDREIRACAELGCATLEDLRARIGVATSCGRCASTATQLLDEHARERARHAPAAGACSG